MTELDILDSPYTIKQVQWDEAQPTLIDIRMTVFVDEQKVPVELEIDGLDAHCIHVIAYDGRGQPIGTARMLADGHIGRMAVLKHARNQGVGSCLLQKLIEIASANGLPRVYLHAQLSACNFYRKHQFKTYGNEFMDADIPHIAMEKLLF